MEYKDKNRFYVNSNITSEIIPKDETISGRRQRRCRVRHKGEAFIYFVDVDDVSCVFINL